MFRISRERRRTIDAHAPGFAAELIADYGAGADEVMRSCLEHPGYDAAERYCFRSVRRELRRIGAPRAATRGLPARLLTRFSRPAAAPASPAAA